MFIACLSPHAKDFLFRAAVLFLFIALKSISAFCKKVVSCFRLGR